MMTAGISTASLFMRLNTEDALPLFEEWGVKSAEAFLTSFSEYDEKFALALRRKAGNIDVCSAHVLGTQFEPQLFSEHPRVRADAEYWLKRAMAAAKALGAKFYSFHGTARMKRTFREDHERTGDRLKEICELCGGYGIRLCLENVEWAYYNRPGVFAALKARCPALGGVRDLKQARLSERPYSEYINEMGREITHVHVSDLDSAGRMCLPGRGTFDFDELLSRLKDVGFSGALLIENYRGDYGDFGELKASYEYLAEKVAKYN